MIEYLSICFFLKLLPPYLYATDIGYATFAHKIKI
jgi:hypothetical protein